MSFLIKCPQCGTTLEADEKYIGVRASCAECNFHFTLQKNGDKPTTTLELLEFDFTNPPSKLTYAKPVLLIVLGETIEVNSWRDILLYCFNYSLTHEKNKVLSAFLDKEDNLFSKKLLLSSSVVNLRQGKELSKNLFLETNFSAVHIIQIVCRLIKFCGFSPKQFLIRYVSHETEDSKTSTKISVTRKSSEPPIDIEDLKSVICQKFNNGFVFNTGTIKLLENILGRECSNVELNELKRVMFKRSDEVYLLLDMVASKNVIVDITTRIKSLFSEYGCFSLSILYEEFGHVLKGLTNPDSDFRLFLLKAILPKLPKGGQICGRLQRQICIPRNTDEVEITQTLSERIRDVLKRCGDAVFIEDIANELPYLNSSVLEEILQEKISDAIEIKVDGLSYWKLIEFFCLPDDFSEHLQLTISSIEDANRAPSLQALSESLNQQYGDGFREIYAIDDDEVFKQVIEVSVGNSEYRWNRSIFPRQTLRQELNVADEFLQTERGVFHESEFFDYARIHRGLTNQATLICRYLRPRCIRLDQFHWISLEEFNAQSNYSNEITEKITQSLNEVLGVKSFLPIGTLPEAVLSSLPTVTVNNQVFYWNHYMLASLLTHKANTLRIVNDEPSPYIVTATLIPLSAQYNDDIVGYIFNDMQQSGNILASADEVFEFLKLHQIRMKKTPKLMERIKNFWSFT